MYSYVHVHVHAPAAGTPAPVSGCRVSLSFRRAPLGGASHQLRQEGCSLGRPHPEPPVARGNSPDLWLPGQRVCGDPGSRATGVRGHHSLAGQVRKNSSHLFHHAHFQAVLKNPSIMKDTLLSDEDTFVRFQVNEGIVHVFHPLKIEHFCSVILNVVLLLPI